jgi:hypothetical protein
VWWIGLFDVGEPEWVGDLIVLMTSDLKGVENRMRTAAGMAQPHAHAHSHVVRTNEHASDNVSWMFGYR